MENTEIKQRVTVAVSCRTAQSLYYAQMLSEFPGGSRQCSLSPTRLTPSILSLLVSPLLFPEHYNHFGSIPQSLLTQSSVHKVLRLIF